MDLMKTIRSEAKGLGITPAELVTSGVDLFHRMLDATERLNVTTAIRGGPGHVRYSVLSVPASSGSGGTNTMLTTLVMQWGSPVRCLVLTSDMLARARASAAASMGGWYGCKPQYVGAPGRINVAAYDMSEKIAATVTMLPSPSVCITTRRSNGRRRHLRVTAEALRLYFVAEAVDAEQRGQG